VENLRHCAVFAPAAPHFETRHPGHGGLMASHHCHDVPNDPADWDLRLVDHHAATAVAHVPLVSKAPCQERCFCILIGDQMRVQTVYHLTAIDTRLT
jgi:hypothetical protein